MLNTMVPASQMLESAFSCLHIVIINYFKVVNLDTVCYGHFNDFGDAL